MPPGKVAPALDERNAERAALNHVDGQNSPPKLAGLNIPAGYGSLVKSSTIRSPDTLPASHLTLRILKNGHEISTVSGAAARITSSVTVGGLVMDRIAWASSRLTLSITRRSAEHTSELKSLIR